MKQNKLPVEWIERIFMRLHGRFGNAFFDKYRIGELNDEGLDIGLENAKLTWSEDLAGMSPERIRNALLHTYDRAPDCDMFKAQCKLKATPVMHKALPRKLTEEEIKANKDRTKNILEGFTKSKLMDQKAD